MADYIYLLGKSSFQGAAEALLKVREVARAKGLTVFLVGGAVRDLTSGSPVRDLDVVVQGNALKLKKDIEKAGGVVTGENEAWAGALRVGFRVACGWRSAALYRLRIRSPASRW